MICSTATVAYVAIRLIDAITTSTAEESITVVPASPLNRGATPSC